MVMMMMNGDGGKQSIFPYEILQTYKTSSTLRAS